MLFRGASSNVADDERGLISEETDGASAREHPYHGGLRFKFLVIPKSASSTSTRHVSSLTPNQTQIGVKDQAMDRILEK